MADPGSLETGGGGSQRGIKFLGSGDRGDALSHIPYGLLVRLENKIHIVNIAC